MCVNTCSLCVRSAHGDPPAHNYACAIQALCKHHPHGNTLDEHTSHDVRARVTLHTLHVHHAVTRTVIGDRLTDSRYERGSKGNVHVTVFLGSCYNPYQRLAVAWIVSPLVLYLTPCGAHIARLPARARRSQGSGRVIQTSHTVLVSLHLNGQRRVAVGFGPLTRLSTVSNGGEHRSVGGVAFTNLEHCLSFCSVSIVSRRTRIVNTYGRSVR